MARFVPYSYKGYKALIEPSPEMIAGLEEVITWAEREAPMKLYSQMHQLCLYMALVNQRFARKMSFGPSDPGGKNTSLAWRVPVRRITGKYYLGWKIKEVRGGWDLYNDSREAYFIEFGINWLGAGRRVRRPIRKLSLKQTLDYMWQTDAYHRIWADIFTHQGKGYGFTQIVQSRGMGSFTGIGASGFGLGARLP